MNNVLQKSPKKISPDYIKSAIVELRYTQKVPFDLVAGFLYHLFLENGFRYTVRPMPNVPISFNAGPQIVNIAVGNQNIYYNDRISVSVLPGVFAFNWIGPYDGWDAFAAELKNAISLIERANIVGSYSRSGVRYISEYQNTNLRDCIAFDFTFNRPDLISSSYQFRTELPVGEFIVLLSLNHNQQIITPTETSVRIASVIDIDVIKEIKNTDTVDVLSFITKAHNAGKDLFFSLLRPEFLATLNPVYEHE